MNNNKVIVGDVTHFPYSDSQITVTKIDNDSVSLSVVLAGRGKRATYKDLTPLFNLFYDYERGDLMERYKPCLKNKIKLFLHKLIG